MEVTTKKKILDAFQYGGLVEKARPVLLVAASVLPFLLREIVKELALSPGGGGGSTWAYKHPPPGKCLKDSALRRRIPAS